MGEFRPCTLVFTSPVFLGHPGQQVGRMIRRVKGAVDLEVVRLLAQPAARPGGHPELSGPTDFVPVEAAVSEAEVADRTISE